MYATPRLGTVLATWAGAIPDWAVWAGLVGTFIAVVTLGWFLMKIINPNR